MLVKSFQSFSSQVDGASSGSNSFGSQPGDRNSGPNSDPSGCRRARGQKARASRDNADALSRNTSVATDVNSDILTITTVNSDKALASRVADTFAEEFVRYRGELDTEGLTGAAADVDARLQTLQEQGQAGSDFFLQLQRTREQLRTQILLGTRNASVVQPSETAKKVGPRPIRSAVLAGVGGLVIAALLAWAGDLIDRRLRSDADVEELFDAPVLARVPRLGRKAEQRNEVVMLTNPESANGEAYRLLASMVQMTNVGGGHRAILIASADAGEGKTTTALNLAVALARAGRSVAVCDLDLRAPTLADRLGLGSHPGVTSILMGEARLQQAMRSVPLPNSGSGTFVAGRPATISVLGSGPRPPNPADFILAPELSALIDALRAEHDVTIIDSPPWLPVSDGLAIAPLADAILTVTKVGVTKRASLANLARALHALPTPVIGQVLTNYPISRDTPYGYGKGASPPGTRVPEDATSALASRLPGGH